MKPLLFSLIFLAGCLPAIAHAQTEAKGPKVTVVIGEAVPELERFAAAELADQFRLLFHADVGIAESDVIPEAAENLILVGSPATNPAIADLVALAADHWPAELSEQGHLVKSIHRDNGKSTLLVGGGSPVATLWAVYELGHSFGMRYLLHGDFPPIDPPEFDLADFDLLLEPNIAIRAWRTLDEGAASQESWGLGDHRKLFGQLAKLKFNRVTMVVHPWQPFYDIEGGDSPKTEGVLWHGRDFPVAGDTAGRSVFGGAEVFQNPDFAGASSATEIVLAGGKLTAGIVAAAERLGMDANFEAGDADQQDSDMEILPLAQPNGGILPQFFTSQLPGRLDTIRNNDTKKGFAVKCSIPGDLNADVYFLSRASFDATLTPSQTLESLATPICGEGVAETLALGFDAIEKVSTLISENDPGFAVPDTRMFIKHLESSDPAPEWWAQAKEFYGSGVNEMYRANTRARDGARPFLLYHAKYFTFAQHYMTAVEHARLAGIARQAKDSNALTENLELGVEAMHSALAIFAEVAQDNSDRGVIAVLNKYAYRPLLEALDEAPLE